MALTPGTVAHFDGSLADEIERAFAAEFYALKQKELPNTGKDERRVLFTAIAQAVLSYLAANPGALAATVGSGVNQQTGTVQVDAPWISLVAPFGSVVVKGGGFPGGASITLSWEEPHGTITPGATAGTDGKFSANVQVGGRSGWFAISAVDGAGNRAIGTVRI
jgi:hypothetical protein